MNSGVEFPIAFTQSSFICSVAVCQSDSSWCEGGGFDYSIGPWTVNKGYYTCWKIKVNDASQLNNICHIINIGL